MNNELKSCINCNNIFNIKTLLKCRDCDVLMCISCKKNIINKCENCEEPLCSDCNLNGYCKQCELNFKYLCCKCNIYDESYEHKECWSCNNTFCNDCIIKCIECGDVSCEKCITNKCNLCNYIICENCIVDIDENGNGIEYEINNIYKSCLYCIENKTIIIQRWWLKIYYHPTNNYFNSLKERKI